MSVDQSQFKSVKNHKEKIVGYKHVGGSYYIERFNVQGRKAPQFIADCPDNPREFKPRNLLSDAMDDVQRAIKQDQEELTPRGVALKAIREVKEKDPDKIIDVLVNQLLDYVDVKFDELKQELEDRLHDLQISVG